MPIRSWQIWNEPNLAYYWKQPFASTYVSLLKVAHAAVKKADPGARVVLGALTNTAWKSLGQIYRIKGAKNLFDVVSVNGFTKIPANVIEFMVFVRRAMAHFGDGAKPLMATEISWPSAKGETSAGFDFITTRAGQARNIATLLPLIGQAAPVSAPHRRLLVHVDGPGGPAQRPVQLLRAAGLPQRQRDRQARAGGVQGRCARARGLQAQGRRGHQLHQVALHDTGHGAGGVASGAAAARSPAAKAAVSGVPALGSVGLAMPYQSWPSVASRSGVTQV